MKLRWKLGVALFVMSMLLTLLPAQTQAAIPEDVFIGETTTGEPDSLDPAVCYETRGGHFITQVYETLYQYDGKSTDLLPSLAKSAPTISSDGLNWTFALRDDVTFSDGTELNASAYKYSIDRAIIMNDPDGPAWMITQAIKNASFYAHMGNPNVTEADAWLGLNAIVANDTSNELTIYLDTNYIPFQAAMTYPVGSAISPSWVYKNLASAKDADGVAYSAPGSGDTMEQLPMSKWFPLLTGGSGIAPGLQNDYVNKHMCGTGPYMLKTWTPNVEMVIEDNPDWWKIDVAASNAPKLTTVYSKIVAETPTRILDLKNADCDFAYVPATNMPEIYNKKEEAPVVEGIQVTSNPSFTVMYIGACLNETLNFAEGTEKYLDESSDSTYDGSAFAKYGSLNPDKSKAFDANPFSALKFRKALAHSFDYDKFIENALNGWGERMVGVIPKGMFGHQDTLDLPEFDLSLAKSLFQEVGWEGTFVLGYNAGNDVRKAGCLLLKDAIEDLNVGIDVTVKEYEWSIYLDHIRHQHLGAFFIGWAPDYADPDNYADPFLASTGTLSKRQQYNNSAVDAAINSAKTEQDPTARKAFYKTVETAAAADIAQIYCYQATSYMVDRSTTYGLEKLSSNPMYSYRYYAELYKDDAKDISVYKPSPGFDFVIVLGVLAMIGAVAVLHRKKR